MKVMPTLQGGLRIDAEDASDWTILKSVVADAQNDDLAGRLGNLIEEAAGGEDWREYVVPDLREAFGDELAQVAVALEAAEVASGGGAGPLWITPEDAPAWYSAFNQARLALEECYRFGPNEDLDPHGLPDQVAAAFIRSRFYCAIQSLLLEYVMK